MNTYTPHTIRIHIPHAHHVSVVGDFNNWHSSAHPLVQVGPDLWERIVDLPAGKHRYAFFVIDDTALTGGNLRSHIVANGAVLWVPEFTNQAVSIIALRTGHRTTRGDARTAGRLTLPRDPTAILIA